MSELIELFAYLSGFIGLLVGLYWVISITIWLVLMFRASDRSGGEALTIHLISTFWLPVVLNIIGLWILRKPSPEKEG